MWFWENAEKEQFLQKQHAGFSFNKITFQLLFRENNKFFYFQPNYPWLRNMSPKYMYSIQMHLQICLPCNVQAILWSQTQSNNCDYIVHILRFVEAIFCIVELFWSASYSVDRLPCCVYYVTPSQTAGTSGSNRPKGRNQRALCL